jgi:hypothetical protein
MRAILVGVGIHGADQWAASCKIPEWANGHRLIVSLTMGLKTLASQASSMSIRLPIFALHCRAPWNRTSCRAQRVTGGRRAIAPTGNPSVVGRAPTRASELVAIRLVRCEFGEQTANRSLMASGRAECALVCAPTGGSDNLETRPWCPD